MARVDNSSGQAKPPSRHRPIASTLQPGDPSHHHALAPAEQGATGVSDGCISLSVEIERIEDIIADVEHGLAAGGRVGKPF